MFTCAYVCVGMVVSCLCEGACVSVVVDVCMCMFLVARRRVPMSPYGHTLHSGRVCRVAPRTRSRSSWLWLSGLGFQSFCLSLGKQACVLFVAHPPARHWFFSFFCVALSFCFGVVRCCRACTLASSLDKVDCDFPVLLWLKRKSDDLLCLWRRV